MNRRKTMMIASASLSALVVAHAAAAADAPATVGELVVTGIRASQEASIQTKRNAEAVVDSITAELLV